MAQTATRASPQRPRGRHHNGHAGVTTTARQVGSSARMETSELCNE